MVPVAVRYDPVTNPEGARPTFYDHNVNTYGTDQNGFARRPLDNVGVQYGLAALQTGRMSKTQFLDLNDKLGGVDIDFNFTTSRTSADPLVLKAVYISGRAGTAQRHLPDGGVRLVVAGGGAAAAQPLPRCLH